MARCYSGLPRTQSRQTDAEHKWPGGSRLVETSIHFSGDQNGDIQVEVFHIVNSKCVLCWHVYFELKQIMSLNYNF